MEPIPVNKEIDVAVSFRDPDANDRHEVCIDWGDDVQTCQSPDPYPPFPLPPVVSTDTLAYASTGIFSVVAKVTDLADPGSFDTGTFGPIIVYDPDGGFVTGGGWIDSPPGAYQPDPSLTGKATFAFVSKYKKDASEPVGDTQFQFKAADMSFSSSSYEWLVVTGSDYARFKDFGTINGNVDPFGQPYRFMVWAKDGTPDTFRIKIWYEEAGVEKIVYDNGVRRPLGGGSIMVHSGKK